ncbi:hypothetical protein HPB49_003185 [Dermacentor silvarum]|uniref:Uncharacterized protein n=1 Tax=Dermacentor silvarum TaxID=543639 RepID=A0ACB8DTR2_DERSI|nr:hypothetical protein HPB49_003185 [Dermacentor silvarum]
MDLGVTADMGWRTTRLRQPAKLSVDSSPQSASTQTSSTRSRSKTRPPVKAQVLKAGRMPPLPSNEIKVIIRPKGALNIAKIGSTTMITAVFQAAQLSPAAIQQDTVCPNTQQNIVIVSTPSPQNADRYVCIKSIQVNGVTHDVNAYETAAEDTTEGVIRGMPLSDTSQQINANIVNTRNPLALAAKSIATTTTVVIAFSGPDVPYLVRFGATLIPCSLYRKQIEICCQCGHLGHRMDVCPFPNNKICRGCGDRNPPPDHTCNPKCSLCGGPHLTADKSCMARYKTPYVIRKRIGERREAIQVTLQESDLPPMNYKHHSISRSPSRSRQHCSRTSSRSRQRRSRSRSTSTPPAKPPTKKEPIKGFVVHGYMIKNLNALECSAELERSHTLQATDRFAQCNERSSWFTEKLYFWTAWSGARRPATRTNSAAKPCSLPDVLGPQRHTTNCSVTALQDIRSASTQQHSTVANSSRT